MQLRACSSELGGRLRRQCDAQRYRGTVEGLRFRCEQVQRTGNVGAGVELEGQHAADPDHQGFFRELRPAHLGSEVAAVDHARDPGSVDAGTTGVALDPTEFPGQRRGRSVGFECVLADEDDVGALDPGDRHRGGRGHRTQCFTEIVPSARRSS
ncbi:hypothetical protein A5767_03125 [Rhodococcus sp. 852002-51564_SCH6189132-a]|nr:hypothetical protein A5767_03125 [Rhodococcus sp. 852002-51564_SCH6189132-a]